MTRFVHGLLPAFIFRTERWMDDNTGARAILCFVLVRGKYLDRGDEGIERHELEHVWQWWVVASVSGFLLWLAGLVWVLWLLGLFVHPIVYAALKRYRLWAEVRAYREQLRWPDGKGGSLAPEKAAKYIAEDYKLDISQADALRMLEAA